MVAPLEVVCKHQVDELNCTVCFSFFNLLCLKDIWLCFITDGTTVQVETELGAMSHYLAMLWRNPGNEWNTALKKANMQTYWTCHRTRHSVDMLGSRLMSRQSVGEFSTICLSRMPLKLPIPSLIWVSTVNPVNTLFTYNIILLLVLFLHTFLQAIIHLARHFGSQDKQQTEKSNLLALQIIHLARQRKA